MITWDVGGGPGGVPALSGRGGLQRRQGVLGELSPVAGPGRSAVRAASAIVDVLVDDLACGLEQAHHLGGETVRRGGCDEIHLRSLLVSASMAAPGNGACCRCPCLRARSVASALLAPKPRCMLAGGPIFRLAAMPARTLIMKAGTMPVRCIIVDDNHEFLRAARDLLEHQGIRVVGVASTGAQARRACQELQPDVVLLDVNLGDETGFEVAWVLAQRAGRAQPRVILISALPPDDFDEVIADSPALTFMPKTALSGTAIRHIIGNARTPAADGVQRDSR